MGAELFHSDGRTDRRTGIRTDMTKPVGVFCNFAKGPKMTAENSVDEL
jgi:hypothetical protein